MSIESIGAVKECMEDLGIGINEQNTKTVTANLTCTSPRSYGTVNVTFHSNWHSGDGPYLVIGSEMRGFGIPFEEFRPATVDFTYHRETKQLHISHENYKFSLQF